MNEQVGKLARRKRVKISGRYSVKARCIRHYSANHPLSKWENSAKTNSVVYITAIYAIEIGEKYEMLCYNDQLYRFCAQFRCCCLYSSNMLLVASIADVQASDHASTHMHQHMTMHHPKTWIISHKS